MLKKLLFFSFILIALLFPVNKVQAAAPDISGFVKTQTGAAVAGVWIKWTDVGGRTRYTQTDSNGLFFFPSWGHLTQSEITALYETMIDTNLDGTPDTRQSSTKGGGFQCFDNPHTFTAVPPVNATGLFSQPTLFLDGTPLTFNNGEASKQVVDILYTQEALSCSCDNLSYIGDIVPASTINLSGNVKGVGDYGKGFTVFHTLKDGAQIQSSAEIPFTDKGAGVYGSDTEYVLPQNPGNYEVFADFSCDTVDFQSYLRNYTSLSNQGAASVNDDPVLKLGTFNPEQASISQYSCNVLKFSL